MKVTISAYVENGVMKGYNRDLLLQHIKDFNNKDIILTIENKTKKRSSPQNRYYWGCVIPSLAYEISKLYGEKVSNETVHEMLKSKFNYKEVVNINGGEVLTIPLSTTDLDTYDFETYLDKCRIFADEFFDLIIPLPNEQSQLI